MTYQHIRIADTIFPWNSVFDDSEENGGVILIFSAGNDKPFGVRGYPAEALRAWMRGELTCPVSATGILDVQRGWEERGAAEAAFGHGTNVADDNHDDLPLVAQPVVMVNGWPEKNRMGPLPPKPPSKLPEVDYNKILERLKRGNGGA